jgi:dynein heavy chain
MQERVHLLSEKYRQELRKYYYVTPTSYLILIKTFETFINEKREKNNKEIYKFDRGLVQLAKAASSVKELQEKLEELIPLVKQQAEEAAVKQKEIEITKVTVDKERAEVAIQEADAKEQKASAQVIADDCQNELDKVMPIYHAALKAVEQLKNNDVTEMASFKTVQPGGPVDLVAKALCIFKGVPGIKIPPQSAKDEVTWDFWKPCKQKVLNG